MILREAANFMAVLIFGGWMVHIESGNGADQGL
jgi:hypothetical protein